jgi:hypothetical protein
MVETRKPPRTNLARGFERLWLALEESDPDWLRLTQSLKTVLAVLLTLGMIYPFAPDDSFLCAVGAGFLMQSGEGANRRWQQLTMVISGLAIIIVAVLGAAASSHQELKEALLIVVAFLIFYLRRFVPRRQGFTAYGFVVCLLATVLPGGGAQALTHAEVLAAALLVAFFVFFFIRPPNPLRAFAVGTRVFCVSIADLLRTLGIKSEAKQVAKFEHLVKRALRFNQALADSFVPGPDSALTDELLVGQYDAWQSLQMLQDSLSHLTPADAKRLPEVWRALESALDSLAASFDLPLDPRLEADPTGTPERLNALQIELLRSAGRPDRSWVYFGGILLAGRRLLSQAERLASSLQASAARGGL